MRYQEKGVITRNDSLRVMDHGKHRTFRSYTSSTTWIPRGTRKMLDTIQKRLVAVLTGPPSTVDVIWDSTSVAVATVFSRCVDVIWESTSVAVATETRKCWIAGFHVKREKCWIQMLDTIQKRMLAVLGAPPSTVNIKRTSAHGLCFCPTMQ
jgi:hypothetical protein